MVIKSAALSQALNADLSHYIDLSLPGPGPDSSITAVACYALRDSLLKKFNNEDKPSEPACEAALEKFRRINSASASWSLEMNTSVDEILIGELKDSLRRFWFRHTPDGASGPLCEDLRQCFYLGRSGPGASVAARDHDMYTKYFDSELSVTPSLSDVWTLLCNGNSQFAPAEKHRASLWPTRVTECSNLSFVNKTQRIARTICTEPSINMWLQLGLGRILETRLIERFGIDIRGLNNQPDVNRQLARAGSITGQFATIDLESASDSLSIRMLEEVLPRSFVALLKLLRTPETKLPTGERVALNMISTMGNGFTFPLQTMLFASVVEAAYRVCEVPLQGRGPADARTFGVFGDDIIVDTRCVRMTLRLLHLLGFKVNSDKTFVEGPFRESCGADYHNGINVRGVYIKRLLTKQDLFAAINSLIRWVTLHGVALDETITLLLKAVGNARFHFVPPDEDDSAGIHVPREYAPLALVRQKSRIGLHVYNARVPTAHAFYILGEHVWTYRGQVNRNYNPEGLWICFLAGGIRGCAVSLRQRKTLYTTKRKCTPNWGTLPPRPLEDPQGHSRYRRFVDACDRLPLAGGLLERHA